LVDWSAKTCATSQCEIEIEAYRHCIEAHDDGRIIPEAHVKLGSILHTPEISGRSDRFLSARSDCVSGPIRSALGKRASASKGPPLAQTQVEMRRLFED